MAIPASTTAKLFFSVPPPAGVQAYNHIYKDAQTGERNSNVGLEERGVVIENLRGNEDAFTLSNAGFQLFHRPTKQKDFSDDETIKRDYYPESIQILKELTGASKVVLFDHTVRRRRPGEIDSGPGKRQPVAYAHVDQTTASSIARVHAHLPASEVPDLLTRRWQLINLWRPIGRPTLDWPLGLCDYRSVEKDDTFSVTLVYPNKTGETMGVKYNPNYKWKYYHAVTPDEGVLIKCFDSIRDGSVAVFTPHSGFEDPSTPAGTPPRESIELRALVFYD